MATGHYYVKFRTYNFLNFGTNIFYIKKIAFKFRSLKVNFRPWAKSSEDLSLNMSVYKVKPWKCSAWKRSQISQKLVRYCLFFNFREKITRSKDVVYDLSIILFLLNFFVSSQKNKARIYQMLCPREQWGTFYIQTESRAECQNCPCEINTEDSSLEVLFSLFTWFL